MMDRSRGEAMYSLLKQQDRRQRLGEEPKPLPSPVRPDTKKRRRDSLSRSFSEENEGATRIVLTPVKASASQQQKHNCEMILTPLRKSARLMKQKKEDILVDKLMDTQYSYANNTYIGNQTISGLLVCLIHPVCSIQSYFMIYDL